MPREHSIKTGNALPTIVCASTVGSPLTLALLVERKIEGGGLSCPIKMVASESHMAVNWRLEARQMSSRRGPAGRVIKVVSLGRQVIDLKSSLRAFEIVV